MIIKNLLTILKKLDRIDTSEWFGHYSSSYVWKRMHEREARRLGWKPRKEIIEEQKRQELQKFYKILSFLNKKGYIRKIGKNGKRSIWKITKRGLGKFLELDVEKDGRLLPMEFDTIEKGDTKVVVFDIPEAIKHCRNWLRQTLINLGFRKLQKSVWIGNVKLPEEFIYNLRKLDILSYVHILSVKDEGTINIE